VTVRRGVRLPLEQLAPYLLNIPDPPAPLDFHAIIGNSRPVEMEIGFGKGLFLLNSAMSRPDVNFLGIEIERKYQLFTAGRMAKRGLTNVRLACGDARRFLRDCVASDSVDALHVYFPDPWWKTRHHKRRLWTPEFAAECARVLRPGGKLHAATDVEEYSKIIADRLAKQPRLQPLPPPQEKTPEHDLDFLTNFERKSRQAGRAVYRSLHKKTELATDERR
jgi:tRNA (guanine-N7-)-methyltransferase